MGNMVNMEYLSLERNLISGSFPSTFNNTAAYQFDVQDNQLTFLPSEIGQLATSINQLDLSNNYISSLPSELFQLTSLHVLRLHGNLIAFLPSEVGQMTNIDVCGPESLTLSNNQIALIPSDLLRLTQLSSWTIENNLISELPIFDWSRLTNLTMLLLWGNKISSTFPEEILALPVLEWLDLSENQLFGTISDGINCQSDLTANIVNQPGTNFDCPPMKLLDLHSNFLTGPLPISITQLSGLEYLDLHNNSLQGSLSTELGLLTNLAVLDVSYNKLTGSIPTEILNSHMSEYSFWLFASDENLPANTTIMQELVLSNNQLEGKLPSEIGLMVDLKLLDVSNNRLTGPIPSEIGNLNTSSSHIRLLGNNFSGSLPESLCPWYCLGCLLGSGNETFHHSNCSTGFLQVDCTQVDCSTCSCDV